MEPRGEFTMRWLGLVVLVMMLAGASAVLAQLPNYNVGRTPTPEQIHAQDITVGPSGKELPPG
jgi:hypothetical protein